MKNKKKKSVSLNDLALMMGKGFLGVDKKFGEVDKRFVEVNKKFVAVHEKMDEGFSEVYEKMSGGFQGAHKADMYFQEIVMLAHKVDRIERWVLQLAENAGVQLKA